MDRLEPTSRAEKAQRFEEVSDEFIRVGVRLRLRELTVGCDEREAGAIRRCRCGEQRVKRCVTQQDEARGAPGLLGMYVEDCTVDRSQFRELLEIGVAGQPLLWK